MTLKCVYDISNVYMLLLIMLGAIENELFVNLWLNLEIFQSRHKA